MPESFDTAMARMGLHSYDLVVVGEVLILRHMPPVEPISVGALVENVKMDCIRLQKRFEDFKFAKLGGIGIMGQLQSLWRAGILAPTSKRERFDPDRRNHWEPHVSVAYAPGGITYHRVVESYIDNFPGLRGVLQGNGDALPHSR